MRALLLSILIVGCGGSPKAMHAPPPGNDAPLTADERSARATTDKDEKPATVAIAEDPCQGGQATGEGGGLAGLGASGGASGDTGAGADVSSRTTEVQDGETTVVGDLDRDVVRRVIKAHMRALKRCYEDGLKRDPALAGKLVVVFTIGTDGKVPAATARGLSADVETCIATQFRRMEFPPPGGHASVKVTFPFTFVSN